MNHNFNCIFDEKIMNKLIVTIILTTFFTGSYAQDHIIGLGSHNFANINFNYERKISTDFHLRLSVSRSLKNGEKSAKKITYDYTSLSAKIFSGDIFDFEFYHGPSVLVGYYYEYTNFENNITYYPYYGIDFDATGTDNNNLPYYQNSSMISPEYYVGLERELGENIYASIELAAGAHFLLNDYMTVLDRFNMGNFVPYVGIRIYISYNYPNTILVF